MGPLVRFGVYFGSAFAFLSILMFLVNLYGPALLPIAAISLVTAIALMIVDFWVERAVAQR